MSATPSTMLDLGTPLPPFRLRDLDGKAVTSNDFANTKGVLVAFVCPHCPFVRHIRTVFSQVATAAQRRGIAVIAINSNDVTAFPDDGPEGMREEAREAGYTFQYLYDESQDVAKAFHAACTPDFFLFDGTQRLVYRGQFDESRPKSDVPVTGKDLNAAIDALLAGKPISADQRPSMGCNIKWAQGNEPEYFKT
jgi:thiol-disulfide isomerase/thioredoxin